MPNKQKKKNRKKVAPNGNDKAASTAKAQRRAKGQLTQGKKLSSQSLPKMRMLGHHVATCSVLDPFCVHARGARRMDGMGGATIALPLRGIVTLTGIGTNGLTRYTFVPSPAFSHLTNGYSAAVFTTAAALTAAPFANTLLTTYAKEVRIISIGIVFRSVMTATTAKGTVIVTQELQPLYSATINAGSIYGESACFSLAANTEFAWISKPIGPTAHNFIPYATFVDTQSNFDWSSVSVEVAGGDTTSTIPMLTAELYYNIEFTIGNTGTGGTGIAQLASTPPAPNPVALHAQARAHTQMPAIFEGAAQEVSSRISSYAATALKDVGEFGLGLLGL